jgi:hypothetical protein
MRIYFSGSTDKTVFPHGWNFLGTDFKNKFIAGASAGQDGSYQMFERAVGINYSEDFDLDHLQLVMRKGMIGYHRDAIEFM